uniref:Sec5 n=4 Tax=Pararge aegeria TaxID=116150 RepID=S4PBV3_9NEOP
MYMGRHEIDADAIVDDARPYVYEIINNLIAVHAEVDSICGASCSRYVRDISETVCEEVSRLWAGAKPTSRAAVFRARLETTLLRMACASHLTMKADDYLVKTLEALDLLENEEEKKRMEIIIQNIKKRMELQLSSLNSCNIETI